MKNILLLVVISSFAIGMVGCKGSDESAEPVAASSSAATDAGTAPPVTSPTKAGQPTASTATPQLNGAAANDPRWKAGTMVKPGGN